MVVNELHEPWSYRLNNSVHKFLIPSEVMASSPGLLDRVALDQNWVEGQPYTVILFYRYVNIDNVDILRAKLLKFCTALGILGRILVAPEGINGTLAGDRKSTRLNSSHRR